MTTRIGVRRFPMSQVALAAVAETKLAAHAVPGVIRTLAPIAAWAAVSIFLGATVGFAAVILPPMGALGIVAVVGLLLLWVMPDLPLVSSRVIRIAFFAMLIVYLCVPYYYTVQIAGLPWISARRLATFALIAPFLLAVAGSADVRRQIVQRASFSLPIVTCAIGFMVMMFVSLGTSLHPEESISAVTESLLSWYVPFFALIYIAKNSEDTILVLKIVCYCAIFITVAGVLEFIFKHRFFVDIYPRSMLTALIESNPPLATLLEPSLRNGVWRASSTFFVSLSFGEFEIIVAPIGLFFALYGRSFSERTLGWAVAVGAIAGIFASGARGGYVGYLVSIAAFVVLWTIRKGVQDRGSLAPAVAGMIGGTSIAVIIALILFWGRAHNMVLGGAAEQASNEGRALQWAAGLPYILANPITGHGHGMSGYFVGELSIDSYVLSLLLDLGIPGFLFFAGLVLLPAWYGVQRYLSDDSRAGALAGALACSFIAFAVDRLVLSQRENHTLFFSLVAIFIVLNYEYHTKSTTENQTSKLRRKGNYTPVCNRLAASLQLVGFLLVSEDRSILLRIEG